MANNFSKMSNNYFQNDYRERGKVKAIILTSSKNYYRLSTVNNCNEYRNEPNGCQILKVS